TSEYYSDLKHIDALLYTKFPAVPEIMKLLSQSVAENLPGLVTEQECNAIKNNLLNEHFKNADLNENHVFKFVTYEDTLNFINDASSFVLKSYKNGSGEQC
ncbi:MAG: hypothetical protein LBI27_04075, partial [Clostridiales bacterium]|nr:hypothetical protein [Clostridiales bacterium]